MIIHSLNACYLQNLGGYFKVRLFYSINFFTKTFAFLTEGNLLYLRWIHCFPGGLVVKNLPASERDAGDLSSVPGLGRFLGEGNGHPIQVSCLENPMNREAMGSQRLRHSWANEHMHSVQESWDPNPQLKDHSRWIIP